MRKIIISIAMIFMLCYVATAQKADYSGQFNVGGLYGSNGTKLQLQTIHGVKYGNFFAGVGLSIDEYYQNSLPLFLHASKGLLRQRSRPFIYANLGANLVDTREKVTDYEKKQLKNGIYYEAGIGYRVGLNSRLACNISLGYSYKDYYEDRYTKYYYYLTNSVIPTDQQNWDNEFKNKYTLERLSMKIGLEF